MMTVKLGERSPRVVLIQILLNRAAAAAPLTVDGRFGPKTLAAVKAFQRQPGYGLTPSGVVDPATWKRLPRGTNMEVIDVVDVGDPNIGGAAVNVFEAAGGDPVQLGLMCNGVGQMITSASGRAKARSVGLLRIMGHGNLGRWLTVSVGDVVDSTPEWQRVLASEDHSYISADNIDTLAPILAPLKSRFAPYGSAEHGGCSLGSREKTRGLLRKLADLWNVPVTVGVNVQRSFLHFDGQTFTAYPSSGTLDSWSKQFQSASF